METTVGSAARSGRPLSQPGWQRCTYNYAFKSIDSARRWRIQRFNPDSHRARYRPCRKRDLNNSNDAFLVRPCCSCRPVRDMAQQFMAFIGKAGNWRQVPAAKPAILTPGPDRLQQEF